MFPYDLKHPCDVGVPSLAFSLGACVGLVPLAAAVAEAATAVPINWETAVKNTTNAVVDFILF